jgi:hypothetical protein
MGASDGELSCEPADTEVTHNRQLTKMVKRHEA